MRKVKFDASVLLIAAMILLLAGGIVAVALTLRSDPVEEAMSGDRVINVLFIVEKDDKPFSTYVLMYYPATRRAAVFDVPGDLGLIIRQINRTDRIDRVYNSQKVAEYKREIERLLGVEMSFFLVMTENNLGKIVDLLEGVELFIPARINTTEGDKKILFPSGVTRMDGDKALLYATFQAPDEARDMAAFRRQRFFLAFLKRLGQMNGHLKNSTLSRLFQPLINTDMSHRTRNRLFDEFAGIDFERINIQSVGGNPREVSGQILLLPHFDGNLIKEIVRQTLGSLTRQIEGSLSDRVFTVEVLNGTTANGLAGRTAELLRSFGYDVISIANADNNDYEKTIIYDRSGHDDVVKEFAEIIRCRNVRSETLLPDEGEGEFTINNFEYRSDFTLIIGRDFDGRYVTRN